MGRRPNAVLTTWFTIKAGHHHTSVLSGRPIYSDFEIDVTNAGGTTWLTTPRVVGSNPTSSDVRTLREL